MSNQTFKTFIHNGLIPVYQDYDPEYLLLADTDSAYLDLSKIFDKDANLDDVVNYADDVAGRVNRTFPSFMHDVFNVSHDKCAITSDREIVADSGLGLTKKRYMFRVQDNEGKRGEKIKIMGLEVKKSNMQPKVKEFLIGLLTKLLDHESRENVNEYIETFKKEFFSMDILDVAVPSNIKTLVKYQEQYSLHRSFKGFPYHVKASMIYNALCDGSDITIRSGDKIKIAYIKEQKLPEFSFKAIALPSDAEFLPDFLAEFEIDYKTMWEKVEKKIQSYLIPIGYDRNSLQKAVVNEFVKF